MPQNHLKIEYPEIENRYVLPLLNLAYKVRFSRRDTRRSIIHVHTPFMNIQGESVVQFRQFIQVIQLIFRHKHRVKKKENCTVTEGSVATLSALWAQTTICG